MLVHATTSKEDWTAQVHHSRWHWLIKKKIKMMIIVIMMKCCHTAAPGLLPWWRQVTMPLKSSSSVKTNDATPWLAAPLQSLMPTIPNALNGDSSVICCAPCAHAFNSSNSDNEIVLHFKMHNCRSLNDKRLPTTNFHQPTSSTVYIVKCREKSDSHSEPPDLTLFTQSKDQCPTERSFEHNNLKATHCWTQMTFGWLLSTGLC